LFGRCPAVQRGAGPASLPGERAGSWPARSGPMGRPRRVPRRRRWLKNRRPGRRPLAGLAGGVSVADYVLAAPLPPVG
jgi:hypothetical protein